LAGARLVELPSCPDRCLQIVGEHAITFFTESPFCTFCTQNLSRHRPWIISCLLYFLCNMHLPARLCSTPASTSYS
jgi:hypothetical protein